MAISLSVPTEQFELKPKITVFGVGGAGGNAVNNMIRSNLEGVEFVVANTDAQSLAQSLCQNRVQLGANATRGLGAGSRPEIGRAAAEEALDEIMQYLHGSNMVFVTAGMGGGTGTGAAAVIARAAKENNILTVAVVTKPFHFEGGHRMRLAEAGLSELEQVVDTLIIIPNQNLFRIANEKTTFADAFALADDVLHSGVRGITDLMVMPGLINLDFADIRTVMSEMGKAMMGTGEADGDGRSIAAAESAISNPLLDDVSMKGARALLINVTGGMDMTLFEIDEATNRIREEVDPDANIIFGSTFDEKMDGTIRISIVATGIDGGSKVQTPDDYQTSNPAYSYGTPVRQKQPVPNFTPFKPQQKPEFAEAGEVRVTAPQTGTQTASVSQPPKAQRQEDSFIPPAAVQPTAPRQAPELVKETAKATTGGSFFSRFTSNSPAPAREATATATVKQPDAEKHEEETLEIPAFLRRQAN